MLNIRRSGLVLLVAGALVTAVAAPAAAATATVPACDRAVTFVVDNTTTYGTLHIPAHQAGQHLAAALLLPGSGPTNRDGDQPPSYTPHTLALIAGVLGDEGIMSLRFDKYGTGQTGLGAYAGDPSRLDLWAQIRQADAAYQLLASQSETNKSALLVVGHSEGGMTAMLVDESVTPHAAGLALLEPQDLRLLDLVRIQLGEQLQQAQAAGQITSAVAQQNKTGIDRVVAEFRANRPVDTTGLLPSIAALFNQALFNRYNARFVRSDDGVYPPAIAASLAAHTRVLVTCGTEDTNVPCPTIGSLMVGLARAGDMRPGLRVLPSIDHYLHPAGTPVNTPMLAPAAVAALSDFSKPWAHSTEEH